MRSIAARLEDLEEKLDVRLEFPCPSCPPGRVDVRLVQAGDEHLPPPLCPGCGRQPVASIVFVSPYVDKPQETHL